jgi:hypothetical protein
MSDEDFRTLVKLLHRYAETELDQWELWRLPTIFGDVFIEVRRSATPGTAAVDYVDLSAWVSAAP